VFASVRFIRPEPVLPVLARLRLVPWLAALVLLALPAAAQAAGNVYVTNGGCCFHLHQPSSISQYAIGGGGLLSPLTPATIGLGTGPGGIAIAPDSKSAYVVCTSGVCQYGIDPQSGALSPKNPATVAAGVGASNVAVTPDDKTAYVTNEGIFPFGAGTVSQYSVDPDSGALSPKDPATVAAGTTPFGIAVTPDGTSAYVTNFFVNFSGPGATVSQYSIDTRSGALSPKNPPTVAAGQAPIAVAVAPDGKSAYVINIDRTVSQYNVDPDSGALSPKAPATVATDPDNRGGPIAGAVTPDGKSAYVVNFGFRSSGTVSQYSIDPHNGALSPKTPATVAAEQDSSQITVTSDGTSAYVTNSFIDTLGTVSQYSIDPKSGTLSPKIPATIAAGPGPWGIAVAPPSRVPTSKGQCLHGGSRDFPQFKNEGRCVAFVEHSK
jgi:DNA-binding beta-propeller fold protein YncE